LKPLPKSEVSADVSEIIDLAEKELPEAIHVEKKAAENIPTT
jgi:hypothetical protein